jgi:Ca-activated chloride channel homolog
MNLQTDRALVPAGQTTTRYVIATLTAPKSERINERPGLNVALVLDRSGSMSGQKLVLAKRAVEQAIAILDGRDRIAVVCYDNDVDTILANTPASGEAKALATSRLRAVDARGSTDLHGGWRRGVDEVSADPKWSSMKRVLVLSDGLANHGETEPDVLAQRAAALRANGVATSTFGLGADFDEILMSRLATEGGGHFYFIEHPAQIPDLLKSELGEALDVVARDARLVVHGSPGVEVTALTGLRVERQGAEVHVLLGDMVSEQELTVVIAMRIMPSPVDSSAVVSLRLTDAEAALFPEPMAIEFEVVDAARNQAQLVNMAVLVAVARQLSATAREGASGANRRGDFQRARQILAAAAAEVRGLAIGAAELERIARELEAQEEQFGAAMSAMALKQEHFASHSLRLDRDFRGKARRRQL